MPEWNEREVSRDRRGDDGGPGVGGSAAGTTGTPGKRTLTELLSTPKTVGPKTGELIPNKQTLTELLPVRRHVGEGGQASAISTDSIDQPGDTYERHADAAVTGRSAAPLPDNLQSSGHRGPRYSVCPLPLMLPAAAAQVSRSRRRTPASTRPASSLTPRARTSVLSACETIFSTNSKTNSGVMPG